MKALKWFSIVLLMIVVLVAVYLIYFVRTYGVPQLFIDILAKIDEWAIDALNKSIK